MKQQCDKCDKPATIHLTEIVGGEKIEKHLCEDCAAAEGITLKTKLPLSEVLEKFLLQGEPTAAAELACDVCGITFSEFREKGLLGCPNDYDAFAETLRPLLERAQEGASQHVGKAPHRAGHSLRKQSALLRLRAQLKAAIASEDYERAAALRDQIKERENT